LLQPRIEHDVPGISPASLSLGRNSHVSSEPPLGPMLIGARGGISRFLPPNALGSSFIWWPFTILPLCRLRDDSASSEHHARFRVRVGPPARHSRASHPDLPGPRRRTCPTGVVAPSALMLLAKCGNCREFGGRPQVRTPRGLPAPSVGNKGSPQSRLPPSSSNQPTCEDGRRTPYMPSEHVSWRAHLRATSPRAAGMAHGPFVCSPFGYPVYWRAGTKNLCIRRPAHVARQ
jgi:hypothetical protein